MLVYGRTATSKANLDDVGGNLLPSTRDLAATQYNLARAQRDIRTAILTLP